MTWRNSVISSTILSLLLIVSCSNVGRSSPLTQTSPEPSEATDTPLGVWVPDPNDTWQWQLEGELNTDYQVDMYDVDLADTSSNTISALQANGAHVVCYFSAGSSEEWRQDASEFAAVALGNTLDGWKQERWLDITDSSVISVMEARIGLAAAKGCDGIEPDNVDGYLNDTGLEFGLEDQVTFNRWLAERAHEQGLSIGLKNALGLVEELVDSFDFAVNEQCWEYEECRDLAPFLAAGKAVFNAEYADRFADDPDSLCPEALDTGLRTLILPLELDDSFRLSCDER